MSKRLVVWVLVLSIAAAASGAATASASSLAPTTCEHDKCMFGSWCGQTAYPQGCDMNSVILGGCTTYECNPQ